MPPLPAPPLVVCRCSPLQGPRKPLFALTAYTSGNSRMELAQELARSVGEKLVYLDHTIWEMSLGLYDGKEKLRALGFTDSPSASRVWVVPPQTAAAAAPTYDPDSPQVAAARLMFQGQCFAEVAQSEGLEVGAQGRGGRVEGGAV